MVIHGSCPDATQMRHTVAAIYVDVVGSIVILWMLRVRRLTLLLLML